MYRSECPCCQGRLELDYWGRFQPDVGVTKAYTARHRVTVRMMCGVNATHVHRSDASPDPVSGEAVATRSQELNATAPLFMLQPSWQGGC